MTEKSKFDLYKTELYDSDEFELEWEDNSSKKINEDTKNELIDNSDASNIDNNVDVISNDKIKDDWDNQWFDFEGDDNLSIDDELNKVNKSLDIKSTKNIKKIIILWLVIWFSTIILFIIIFIFLGWDNEPRKIIKNTIDKQIVNEDINEQEAEIIDDEGITILSNSGNISETFDNNPWNTVIEINDNSWDDIINITEAILSPSDIKVTINTLWEFDWNEVNEDWDISFIKIKENSLVIPTVSKANFVPNLEIEVLNKIIEYSTSDLIKIEFNVLLNSKTLSYTITKKIYKEKDFIIDLTLNNINSDIVSIEENLIKEELTIPINLMYKWEHTVWFKINNYPVESYNYNIR